MQHAAQGHKSFTLEAPHPNAQMFLGRMMEGDEMTLEVTDGLVYRLDWGDSTNHFGGTLNLVSEASNILRIRQAIERSIWSGGKTVDVETGLLHPATVRSLHDSGYNFHEIRSNRLVFDFKKE